MDAMSRDPPTQRDTNLNLRHCKALGIIFKLWSYIQCDYYTGKPVNWSVSVQFLKIDFLRASSLKQGILTRNWVKRGRNPRVVEQENRSICFFVKALADVQIFDISRIVWSLGTSVHIGISLFIFIASLWTVGRKRSGCYGQRHFRFGCWRIAA